MLCLICLHLCLCYNYCNTKSFASCCKQRLLRPFMTLQQDISEVGFYNLGYIYALPCIRIPFYSESNSVIFNYVHFSNHKLWSYNFNRHIGKPCIASLTFTACNWELVCNTNLILLQKKAFSAQNIVVQ